MHSMKNILAFALFIIISTKCFAQHEIALINSFNLSVIKNIQYPPQLMAAKSPTFATIKIAIDKNGKIITVNISDNTAPSFKQEFVAKKQMYNITALRKYIVQQKLKNIALLIPIWIYFSEDDKLDTKQFQGLMKFNELQFTGNAIIFKPIDDMLVTKSEN